MATNHEKYLAGEPLNEELAAIRAGRLPEFGGLTDALIQQSPQSLPLEDAEKPLTKDERLALREIRLAPGWPVLQKLLERSKIATTKAAIVLSQDDPLARDEQLKNAWLYVKVWKQVITQLNWSVAIEAESLVEDPHGRGQTNSPLQRA